MDQTSKDGPTSSKISATSILVNEKQRGNDLLKKLAGVTYSFDAKIKPDFVLGRTTCALYLSIRFHAIKPNYIYERIRQIGDDYELRVLLVVVDHVEHKSFLKELSKVCIKSDMTLMLCWSVEDAAMYLKKYRLNEDTAPKMISDKQQANYEYEDALDQYMIDALAESKSINRTDATSIVGLFDNFARITRATPEELSICPGVGMQKAQRLYDLLHKRMRRGLPSHTRQSSQGSQPKDGDPEPELEAHDEDTADGYRHNSASCDNEA